MHPNRKLPTKKNSSILISLKDRIRSRGVSRSWRQKFDSCPVKSLCYSENPRECIFRKSRLLSDEFDRNFISSPNLEQFFNTFRQSMLGNLKHLRLCEIGFNAENRPSLAPILNSLEQLEELDVIQFAYLVGWNLKMELELNLPMLRSIQLMETSGIEKLTLDAPRLQNIRLLKCACLNLLLVHPESVQRLIVDVSEDIPAVKMKQLKNLKCLYGLRLAIDSTFLSGMHQLKEVHLDDRNVVLELFEQKQRYGRADLKIYLCGLLLNGPEDPAMSFHLNFHHLTDHSTELAAEMPFSQYLNYNHIERVQPEMQAILLSKFTNLYSINVNDPAVDIQRLRQHCRVNAHV